jgi:hypothetical protein
MYFTLEHNSGRTDTVELNGTAFGAKVLKLMENRGEGGRDAILVRFQGRQELVSMRDLSGVSKPIQGVTNANNNQRQPNVPNPNARSGNNNQNESVPRPRIRRRVVLPSR